MPQWILLFRVALFLTGWTLPDVILKIADQRVPGTLKRLTAEELYENTAWTPKTVTWFLVIIYSSFFIGVVFAAFIVNISPFAEVQAFLFPWLVSTVMSIPTVVSEIYWQISPVPQYRKAPLFDVGDVLQKRGMIRAWLVLGMMGIGILIAIASR